MPLVPETVHIVTGVLLVVTLFLAHHVVERAKLEPVGVMLNPYLFLPLFLAGTAVAAKLLGFEHFILAATLVAGIMLGFAHPMIAVSFFVANQILRPWELMEPNPLMQILPRLLAGLAMMSWIAYRARKHDFDITWNSPCVYFLALIATFFLSACIAFNPGESISFFTAAFIPVAALAFIVLNSASDILSIRAFRGTIVIAISGLIGIAMYLTLTKSIPLGDGNRLEAIGLWSNSNDLAALIVLAFPLAAVPWLFRVRTFSSVLATIVLGGLLLTGLWMTQSRGAILALALGIGITILSLKKLSFKTLLLLGTIGALPILLYLGIHRDEADLKGSSSSRFNYVITGFKMLRHNPIVGVGPGNYMLLFEQYTSDFNEWGQRTAHSSWVLAMSEGGLLGLLLFASLYFSVLKRAWRIRRQMPELLLSMLTYGVAMSFLSHTYLIAPYVLFALVLGAERALKIQVKVERFDFSRAVAFASLLLLLARPASAEEPFTISALAGGDKPLGTFAPRGTGSLELYGSRGEVRNFMLQVSGAGCADLTQPPFTSGTASAQLGVKLFAMKGITTELPSFPGAFVGTIFDPLIPLPSPTLCARSGITTWIWGEIAIPKSTPAGTYRSEFSLGSARLPVIVKVWKMEIPERFALPAYSELTTWFNLLGHYGQWHEGEAQLADKYAASMLEHRIIPVKSAISIPPVEMQDTKPVLNVTSAPDAAQSFAGVSLKNRPDWAYFDFPTVKPEEINDPKTPRYLAAVENSLEALKRPGKAFFYLWDEPKKEMMPALKILARLAKQHAPSVKVMVTTPWSPDLDKLVDIFCPVMEAFQPHGDENMATYKRIRKSGHEFWWYVSCMSHGCDALADTGTPDMMIDRPSVYIRSIPWLSALYGADAFLYYSVNNFYQYFPKKDPWQTLWDFSGNGDGTLFYPGRPGENGQTEHGPIPSVRLKVWREASFDAEYIKWIEAEASQPEWFKAEFKSLVSSVTSWSHEYGRYEALRIKIGEHLNSK